MQARNCKSKKDMSPSSVRDGEQCIRRVHNRPCFRQRILRKSTPSSSSSSPATHLSLFSLDFRNPRMLRACERTLAMAAHPLRLAIVGDVVSISLYKPRFLLLAILFRSSTKKIKSKETIAINSLLLYCLLRAFASLVLLSRNTGHRYPRLSAGVLKRCRLHQESSKSKDTIEFNSLLSSLLFCFRFSCSAVSKPWPSPLTSFRRCQKRCRDTIAPS